MENVPRNFSEGLTAYWRVALRERVFRGHPQHVVTGRYVTDGYEVCGFRRHRPGRRCDTVRVCALETSGSRPVHREDTVGSPRAICELSVNGHRVVVTSHEKNHPGVWTKHFG